MKKLIITVQVEDRDVEEAVEALSAFLEANDATFSISEAEAPDSENLQVDTEATQIRRRSELAAMAYGNDKHSADFYVPAGKNFNDDYLPETVLISVDTHLPTKWRFVDLETGQVWRWARPEERNWPNQTFIADAFCETRRPDGRFWHAR